MANAGIFPKNGEKRRQGKLARKACQANKCNFYNSLQQLTTIDSNLKPPHNSFPLPLAFEVYTG